MTYMPKTLIVDFSLRYGGAISRVLQLIEEFPEGTCALACIEGSAPWEHAKEKGIPFFTVGTRKTDPRIVGRLVRIIRDNGFEVLDTQNIQSKLWASLARRRTGTALVSTLNSWYTAEHGKSLKGKAYIFLEKLTYGKRDLFIMVSKENVVKVQDAGYPPDTIELIYNAVSINQGEVEGDRDWMFQRYGLPEDSIVMVAVGRFVWAKGYETLMDAMHKVSQDHPNAVLLMVGDGVLGDSLKTQVASLGLGEKVRFLGFLERSEVLSIVKNSDLYLMPSRSEGTPVALLEAAALGTPILASNAGGIPELVEHGEHAHLVPVGDSDVLAEAIELMLTDTAYAQKLADAARKHTETKFSVEAQVEATRQAYCKAFELNQKKHI